MVLFSSHCVTQSRWGRCLPRPSLQPPGPFSSSLKTSNLRSPVIRWFHLRSLLSLLGPPHECCADAHSCLTAPLSCCLAGFVILIGTGSHLAACWSHPRSFKKVLKLKSHKRFCLNWPEVTCNLGIEIFRCPQDGSQVHLRLRSLSFFVSCPLL